MGKNKFLKVIGFVLVVFLAAVAGVYFGGKIGGDSESVPEVSADTFQDLKLRAGINFPDIELLDRFFEPVDSGIVLSSKGTVVVFMDPNCPPCKNLAEYWQSIIDNGELLQEQVVGICFFNASQIEEIYLNYNISFPVYSDETFQFYDNYGVDAFPLTLVIDKSGIIRKVETESYKRIKVSEMRKLF